jgi:endo-1,4-beta-xylanase
VTDSFDSVVNYTGTYKPTGNSYLALYGYSGNPYAETYVMESFASHNPTDNTNMTYHGSHFSDGAYYEVWDKFNGNLHQYWSIRHTNRVGGTITFKNHYDAWNAAGLKLGALQNFFIAVEGQPGTGTADLTVGKYPTTSVVETPTPTTRSLICVTTSYTVGPVCKPGQTGNPTTKKTTTTTPKTTLVTSTKKTTTTSHATTTKATTTAA